jgi:hypothetical protein
MISLTVGDGATCELESVDLPPPLGKEEDS